MRAFRGVRSVLAEDGSNSNRFATICYNFRRRSPPNGPEPFAPLQPVRAPNHLGRWLGLQFLQRRAGLVFRDFRAIEARHDLDNGIKVRPVQLADVGTDEFAIRRDEHREW